MVCASPAWAESRVCGTSGFRDGMGAGTGVRCGLSRMVLVSVTTAGAGRCHRKETAEGCSGWRDCQAPAPPPCKAACGSPLTPAMKSDCPVS